MPEPKTVWVKSKWKAEELNGQRIEFRLRLKPGRDVAIGFGTIWVQSRPFVDDLLHVQIVAKGPEDDWTRRQNVFSLSQRSVDYIVLHPDQKIARFQLVMP